jgi:hypothetical protein
MKGEPRYSILSLAKTPAEGLLEQYTQSGRLPEAGLASLEEHLLICPGCQDGLQTAERFLAATRAAAKNLTADESKEAG